MQELLAQVADIELVELQKLESGLNQLSLLPLPLCFFLLTLLKFLLNSVAQKLKAFICYFVTKSSLVESVDEATARRCHFERKKRLLRS